MTPAPKEKCFCLYKIPGHPNSACPHTATKEKGWEEEFDEQFCVEDVEDDNGKPLGRQINIEFDTKDLKAFIERTLSQQKREIVELLKRQLITDADGHPLNHSEPENRSILAALKAIDAIAK
jgi:hypothetical protein